MEGVGGALIQTQSLQTEVNILIRRAKPLYVLSFSTGS